jgi:phosphoglycerate dehydrogenase-like enzyme
MEILSHTIHSNNWRNKEDQLRGYELSNFNFGIFGYGRIGKNISKFLKIFTNRIHYYDPHVNSKYIKKISNVNNFLKKTDYLIISSKLNNKTLNFFNKTKLKLLKKNSFLLNISRGELIVEKDLINLIKKNYFKKVIIDVVSKEDKILNGENEIVKLSRLKNNLIITPHIAGLTYNSEYKALNKMKQLIHKYL